MATHSVKLRAGRMQAHGHNAGAESLLGREVGAGLRIERLLAVGELMAVYAAKSPTRGALAVKLLHADVARRIGGELPSVLRTANQLAHPRAPEVSEEVAVGDTLGVVTPLVVGESLGSLLRRRGALPPSEALRIGAQTLDVLTAAHDKRLVHGALTVSHVLIAEDGAVHLVGFGERRLLRAIGRDVPAPWRAPEASSEADSPSHDLWATVALVFAMLTGKNPFDGAIGARELPEHAAIRSLEQVVPHAPKALVRLVDRALAVDAATRWVDAGALAAAFVTVALDPEILLAPALSSRLRVSSVAPPIIDAVRELRRTAPPISSKPPVVEQRAIPTVRPAASGGSGPLGREDVARPALERLVHELGQAVLAELDSDPAQTAALDALSRAATVALRSSGRGVAIRVSGDASLAPGPLDGALAALRRAGIQTLGFLPGVAREELAELVRLFAHVTRSKLSADAFSSELWRADFQHVYFVMGDPLAGLERDERERLEAERRRLLALFGFDSSFQLEDAWSAARLAPPAAADYDRKVEELALMFESATEADERLLAPSTDTDERRLALLAASALEGAAFEPALEAFGPLLRRDVELRARTDPSAALGSIAALLSAVRAPEGNLQERRRALAAAVISPALAGALFRRLGASQDHRDLELLSELLPPLGAEHAPELALAARVVTDLKLRSKISHRLETGMSGHEAGLAALAESPELDTALEIVRLLGRIDTLAARQALERAAGSPHLVVRCEAMGLRGGPAADQLRQELRRALEEAPEDQRIEAIRTLADADVRVAAPVLALRLKSPGLDSLPFEERRSLFAALCRLAPSRAEVIARELLTQSKLITSSDRDDTRALAAWALGTVGDQDETVELLEDLARRRWGSSEKVRETAEQALGHVVARRQRRSGAER